ncbi:gamma-glutamyl-gamma-aminobutyrate hydrolase [Spirochaetia bacterium]|nr:gamma-glutamyl-gamma-aminobutyrate hydrolase [Spirochaetia bacterium]
MAIQSWPRIGVTADLEAGGTRKHFLNESYAAALYRARALPLVLPAPHVRFTDEYETIAEAIIAGVDGLLLSGGDDMDARIYNEENYAFNGAFTEERDRFELALCRYAIAQGKPLLGICRGIQAMNVALGGSLFQDIASQCRPAQKLVQMHAQKAPAYTPVHEVDVARTSYLAHILLDEAAPTEGTANGPDTVAIPVNSFHHQAVNRVAPGFTATAHAHDGIIEAIEPADGAEVCRYGKPHPFTIGVQWHPERMDEYHTHAERLFAAFAAACAGKN